MINALLAVLVVMICAAPALAQPPKKAEARPAMRHEDRQKMRDDMRDAYKERAARPERQRPMTPGERDQLRRDVQNASKDMRR